MGSKDDFDEFVVTRSARLLRTAYLLTRDWAEAEDLLQTALMKAWFVWARLDDQPEAYVRRVIATTFTSLRRRRWWSREVVDGTIDDRAAPAQTGRDRAIPDGTAAVDDRFMLWPALGRLPARQRAVIVLRFFEDLTEAQVATALGIHVGTVKSQTSKALERLRAETGFADDRAVRTTRADIRPSRPVISANEGV